jgi:hypothetical protein
VAQPLLNGAAGTYAAFPPNAPDPYLGAKFNESRVRHCRVWRADVYLSENQEEARSTGTSLGTLWVQIGGLARRYSLRRLMRKSKTLNMRLRDPFTAIVFPPTWQTLARDSVQRRQVSPLKEGPTQRAYGQRPAPRASSDLAGAGELVSVIPATRSLGECIVANDALHQKTSIWRCTWQPDSLQNGPIQTGSPGATSPLSHSWSAPVILSVAELLTSGPHVKDNSRRLSYCEIPTPIWQPEPSLLGYDT